MSEIVRWGDISFFVSPTSMRGIKDIAIEAGCETEESTVDNEKFVKRKNGNPYSISMTALLDARLGEDVQSVATQMTEAARLSRTGYFYTGGAKLFPSQFMMVTAKISNIELMPGGKWMRCEVAMTLKQCTKYDGTTTSASNGTSVSSGGGGSSSGSSSSKVSTKTTPTSTTSVASARLKTTRPTLETARNNAVSSMNALLNQAKTQSQNIVVKAAAAQKATTSTKISTVSGARKGAKDSVR